MTWLPSPGAHVWRDGGRDFRRTRWRTWFACARCGALAIAWGKGATEPTELRGGPVVTLQECRGIADAR